MTILDRPNARSLGDMDDFEENKLKKKFKFKFMFFSFFTGGCLLTKVQYRLRIKMTILDRPNARSLGDMDEITNFQQILKNI